MSQVVVKQGAARDRSLGSSTGVNFGEHFANARDEGFRIELGAHDLVGTIRQDGDTPVADESDELFVPAVLISEQRCSASGMPCSPSTSMRTRS